MIRHFISSGTFRALDGFIEACARLLRSVEEPGIADRTREQTGFFVANEPRSYGAQLVDLVDRELERNARRPR